MLELEGHLCGELCIGFLHHVLYMRQQVPQRVDSLIHTVSDAAETLTSNKATQRRTRRAAKFIERLTELEEGIETVCANQSLRGNARGLQCTLITKLH